ncbi:MAG: hypothetical protein IPH20_08590 [Bacteroidales bacterium]|nr:hypothetical protein [Bacteroidales bacterium]
MISEAILLKQLSILLISAVKLLAAAPVSYLFGYSYLHTLLNTAIGGLMGVVFFFFLSRNLIRLYYNYAPFILRKIRTVAGMPDKSNALKPLEHGRKKIFNRRNRVIVKIRTTYGMPGIIILTPIFLSIPFGTFLALKYYSSRRNLLAWLSLSVILWSVLLTTFVELM